MFSVWAFDREDAAPDAAILLFAGSLIIISAIDLMGQMILRAQGSRDGQTDSD